METLYRCQIPPRAWEFEGKAVEFFEVDGRERLEAFGTDFGELDADDSVIFWVPSASDQASRVSTVDEADSAVMAQQEIVRHLADSGTARVCVATNGQQQLVLSRRQPGRLRLLFAPTFEVAQAGP